MKGTIVSFFFLFFFLSLIVINPLILCIILVILSSTLGLILQHLFSVWMFNALMLIFLGGIIVLFLYISILSNNEKMQIPARVRSIGLIFLLVLFTFNTQNFFNRSTYSSGTRSEAGTDTSLIYHALMSPHILFLIGVLIVALFCVVKMTEGFKGSLIKNVDS